MSKKVTFSRINQDAVSALNSWITNTDSVNAISVEYKDREQALRDNAIADKMTAEEMEHGLQTLKAEKQKALKPHKDAIQAALDTLTVSRVYPDGDSKGKEVCRLHEAYKKAFEAGKFEPLKNELRHFLVVVGAEGADNKTALDKFVQLLLLYVSGARKASAKKTEEDGRYTALKSKKQFIDLFVRSFVDILLDKGYLTIETDGTVSKK